ncbi:MAG TPA: ATPase [Myxococcota bacterium]|nr:ATPase [Myxococcota bacterium]HRY95841.1 ATPase [Myxococcota bacterium]
MSRDQSPEPDTGSTLVGMTAVTVDEGSGDGAPAEALPAAQEAPASPRAGHDKAPRTNPNLAPVRRPRAASEPTFMPEQPRTVTATGLSYSYLEDLVLKHLFQAGDLQGGEIVQRTCLPSTVIDEILGRLKRLKFVDLKGGGTGLGQSRMVYGLTEAGHADCELSMERDRYVGPAPVPFAYYQQAVAAQTIRGNRLRREDLAPRFTDLVMRDEVYDAIGPAMNSGKALFFYGPPGNGKTAICQRMTDCFGGDVFVPHAIIVDDFVIKVLDETIHRPQPLRPGDPPLDGRWVRCHRPMVIVGGELTMEDLNLRYSSEVRYYEAPVQLKANNGMLLIDDFGRQTMSPKELLNRWIVPLESEFDFLAMHTGKKLQVPFDVFVVFSTNLDPKDLVDAAFLRRVRYKLEVSRPDEGLFTAIFEAECKKRGIPYEPGAVKYLVGQQYKPRNLPFNACEPRDLLAQVTDLCAYRGQPPMLTPDVLDRVCANYFVRFS